MSLRLDWSKQWIPVCSCVQQLQVYSCLRNASQLLHLLSYQAGSSRYMGLSTHWSLASSSTDRRIYQVRCNYLWEPEIHFLVLSYLPFSSPQPTWAVSEVPGMEWCFCHTQQICPVDLWKGCSLWHLDKWTWLFYLGPFILIWAAPPCTLFLSYKNICFILDALIHSKGWENIKHEIMLIPLILFDIIL